MSPSSNIYLQICVFAALLLALIANNNLLVQASPQFSVFNRQLFPSFSFPSFSRPSRPTFNSVQRPQQRPSVFRPAPSPAPIVTRIVTTTVAPATTTRTTAATLIREPIVNVTRQPTPAPTTPRTPAPTPRAPKAIAAAPAPSKNCNPRVTNVEFEGKHYFVQWKNRFATKYTWDGAKNSCARIGMKMISMDNPAKREFFLNMLERDHYEYFWAGGKISRGTLVWQNGRSERIFRGRYPWSHAGFSGPQPEGNGDCLAILNNVYQDRVKYHDVACHHKKPTICECP